jgi:hypothetical protein
MSALTVVLCIWAFVAFCAILFIRGSSPRVVWPKEFEKADPTFARLDAGARYDDVEMEASVR